MGPHLKPLIRNYKNHLFYHGDKLINNQIHLECEESELLCLEINCALLFQPFHIFCQLAGAIFELPKRKAIKIATCQSFVLFLTEWLDKIAPSLIILDNIDELNDESGSKILWTLCHLDSLVGQRVPLYFFLISRSRPLSQYMHVFDSVLPYQIFLEFEPNFLKSTILETCPENINLSLYSQIVKSIYDLCQDRICDSSSLENYLRKILPIYLRASSERNIPLKNIARLYQECKSEIKQILDGSYLNRSWLVQIQSLTVQEKFIIIASWLASNNPAKFDLKVFSSEKSNTATLTQKASGKQKFFRPKKVPQDRILAIFYFICPDPVPILHDTLYIIDRIVAKGLVKRVEGNSIFIAPKYRNLLSIDHITSLSNSVKFDLPKFYYYAH